MHPVHEQIETMMSPSNGAANFFFDTVSRSFALSVFRSVSFLFVYGTPIQPVDSVYIASTFTPLFGMAFSFAWHFAHYHMESVGNVVSIQSAGSHCSQFIV